MIKVIQVAEKAQEQLPRYRAISNVEINDNDTEMEKIKKLASSALQEVNVILSTLRKEIGMPSQPL